MIFYQQNFPIYSIVTLAYVCIYVDYTHAATSLNVTVPVYYVYIGMAISSQKSLY